MYPYYFISPFYDKYNVYKPVYDDRVDYQTNAKSYYDYLARYNKELVEIENFINRLLKRDLQVSDTDTINLVKKGHWLSDDCCRYDDIIHLQSNVKISSHITLKFLEATKKQYELNNAIQVFNEGLYVPNLLNLITALDNEIVELQNAIKKINQEITNIYQDIKNINQEITNIKNDITNIYNQLNALSGTGNYLKLTKGKDYTLKFYNGYSTAVTNGEIYVGYVKITDGALISIKQSTAADGLTNPKLVNTVLSHAEKIEHTPKSWIFGITFLGDYAFLNNYNIFNFNELGSSIWNVAPVSERASWRMAYRLVKNIDNKTLNISTTSYADGYNTQFTQYKNDNLKLNAGNFNFSITLNDPKKEVDTEWQADLQEMLSQKHQ